MTPEYLFVYGTLRKDANTAMHRLLAQYADCIGTASYQGRLYKVAHYPGVVPSENPAHQTKGEVYTLREPELILPKLDEYEECGPGFAEPTEYIREKREVVQSNGQTLMAWIYIYQRPTENLPEITSGDFLNNTEQG